MHDPQQNIYIQTLETSELVWQRLEQREDLENSLDQTPCWQIFTLLQLLRGVCLSRAHN